MTNDDTANMGGGRPSFPAPLETRIGDGVAHPGMALDDTQRVVPLQGMGWAVEIYSGAVRVRVGTPGDTVCDIVLTPTLARAIGEALVARADEVWAREAGR